MRDKATSFPADTATAGVKSLRVWHCKYKTLARLAEFSELEELIIGTLPDNTLQFLSTLTKLKFLAITNMPNISELSPLAACATLETLSFETSPAWDSAGRRQEIESLEPIAKLHKLKHLQLFGVCPPDGSLLPILKCQSLHSARFSQFPKDEVERFYDKSGVANSFNPRSTFG